MFHATYLENCFKENKLGKNPNYWKNLEDKFIHKFELISIKVKSIIIGSDLVKEWVIFISGSANFTLIDFFWKKGFIDRNLEKVEIFIL